MKRISTPSSKTLLRLITLTALLAVVGCDDAKKPAPEQNNTAQTTGGAAGDTASDVVATTNNQTTTGETNNQTTAKDAAANSPDPPDKGPVTLMTDRPRTQKELPTTPCGVFLGNINSQRKGYEKIAKSRADSHAAQLGYASTLFNLGQVYGNLTMMDQAQTVATKALALKPKHIPTLMLRAKIQDSLHRYKGARADMLAAKKLQPDNKSIQQALDGLAWQLGEYGPAQKGILAAVTAGPNFDTQVAAALMYMQLGDVKRAERHFALAEMMHRTTAPIPIAWLNVQRGLLAMHSGQYEKAQRFFTEGYSRCPEYPMATEHLAEIEGRLGNLDRSIELYGAVVSQTTNPEFAAALAEKYLEKGDKDNAKKMIILARAENEKRLKRFPEAMYWHAADFYLSLGEDPKKGMSLLEKNVKLRPNATSYAALAQAQFDNGKLPAAKKSIDRALASPLDLPEFHWTAARVYKALEATKPPKAGQPSKAEEHRKKALALNPKIADLEGPLDGE